MQKHETSLNYILPRSIKYQEHRGGIIMVGRGENRKTLREQRNAPGRLGDTLKERAHSHGAGGNTTDHCGRGSAPSQKKSTHAPSKEKKKGGRP